MATAWHDIFAQLHVILFNVNLISVNPLVSYIFLYFLKKIVGLAFHISENASKIELQS